MPPRGIGSIDLQELSEELRLLRSESQRLQAETQSLINDLETARIKSATTRFESAKNRFETAKTLVVCAKTRFEAAKNGTSPGGGVRRNQEVAFRRLELRWQMDVCWLESILDRNGSPRQEAGGKPDGGDTGFPAVQNGRPSSGQVERPEDHTASCPEVVANHADVLTEREREVLTYIAQGHSTKQVGGTLGISFKTAACHRYRVMQKLGIHDTATLVRFAVRNGFVRP